MAPTQDLWLTFLDVLETTDLTTRAAPATLHHRLAIPADSKMPGHASVVRHSVLDSLKCCPALPYSSTGLCTPCKPAPYQ
ncbi:hypothetical protein SSPS47_19395 [Streptomyces sp. S4.7]|nr:hypothetical protein SSPS47_19395 [Streptomyces sp. S4.7]